MRCDLHMHSTVSDGSLSVTELVGAVHDAGVQVFSLTDHDSVAGLGEARDAAARLGLTLLSGVEISTRLERLELHILGYGFEADDPGLRTFLAARHDARRSRIQAIVHALNGLGLALHEDDVYRVAGNASPGRPHVAQALLARGLVASMEEAFQRYLGDAAPAAVRTPLPSPARAIACIHAAGGKAVWAHPLARPIHRPGGFDRLARELRRAGLDGIEEVHPAHMPPARRRIRRMAAELGLVCTGGSDYHGAASPDVHIGVGRGRDSVSAGVVDALLG